MLKRLLLYSVFAVLNCQHCLNEMLAMIWVHSVFLLSSMASFFKYYFCVKYGTPDARTFFIAKVVDLKSLFFP